MSATTEPTTTEPSSTGPTITERTTSRSEGSGPHASGTMRAIVHETYGDAGVLQFTTIAVPTIGAREVLVRVRAAGLDRGTWHLMAGRPYLIRGMGFGLRAPKQRVPGLDVAGTVAAVGEEVTRFAVGDEVYGIGRGSFAELCVVEEQKLARKPANLTWEQAAVVPVSGGTALQAVGDVGRVEAGQRVLVLGASGGVGSFAVQIAHASGASVTGVCSAAKADLVRALGADRVLDYTRDDPTDGTAIHDLIIDTGGCTRVRRLRRALAPRGTLVIVGGEGGGSVTGGFGRPIRAALRSPFTRQRFPMLVAKERAEDLDRLRELIEAGAVTPCLDRSYPLADAAQAMRRLVAGEARGKIAVTI